MSEEIQQTNYKGLLQQYCLVRYPSPPVYETRQVSSIDGGRPPKWLVSIQYSKEVFEISKPIEGSKKYAEQEAARQLMEKLESKQTEFLAGEKIQNSQDESSVQPVSEEPPISVPSEIVAAALEIASQRLHSLPNTRHGSYRRSNHDDFTKQIGELTIKIVRSIVEAAGEKNQVDFGQKTLNPSKNDSVTI